MARALEPIVPIERTSLHLLDGLPYWFRAAGRIATRLDWGSIVAVLPDGRRFRFSGREQGVEGVLIVNDFRFARDVLRGGNIGFAESYIAGHWETPDLTALLEVVARNSQRVSEYLRGRPLLLFANRLLHALNANTRRGARRNIAFHYDLGNDFYGAWLDPTMTYSSARFADANQDLADAQLNKYRALARKIALGPDQNILEVGCGWGGFAEFAAREYGCRVTGITISPSQHAFARQRIFEAGLAEKVDIKLIDYRDVGGRYDRIASIEMFEAVGERYWPVFFNTLAERLKPGGLAGLQIITIADRFFDEYRRGADFIRRHIFPGGLLPSPGALAHEISRAGLDWRATSTFGRDYAQTLARWRERFRAAWPRLTTLGFDERFRRLWEFYLSYCEAGFRAGNIDVAQLSLARP